jgi:isobutyryl-CoA mutase
LLLEKHVRNRAGRRVTDEQAESAADTSAAPAAGPVRVVTAASLFDGHDASINLMRRLLQGQGAEVIHLGHDRSVADVATAVIQEDARAVCVSSYQGGHMEFFRYLVQTLREAGAGDVLVYGGGGGTISPEEIAALRDEQVARIFSPEDGQRLGLEGMIQEILDACRARAQERVAPDPAQLSPERPLAIARAISWLEARTEGGDDVEAVRRALEARSRRAPVIGFTGTGGAGKSSLVDELVRRYTGEFPERRVGVLMIDPSRRRSGGALLGDRLRMNSIQPPRVYARSLATRQAHISLSRAVEDGLRVLQAAGFDLILVETAGIGQSGSEIVDVVDHSIYVMTPEYGAPSQLEKIDMLDLADFVVLNKFDRRGGEDALRDVRKQWRRNRAQFEGPAEALPVFPTVASVWDDPGTDRFYRALRDCLEQKQAPRRAQRGEGERSQDVAHRDPIVPPARVQYLAEIAASVRDYRRRAQADAERAREAQSLARALAALGHEPGSDLAGASDDVRVLAERHAQALAAIEPGLRAQLAAWPATRERYTAAEQHYEVRGRRIGVKNHVETLYGTAVPRVAVPRGDEQGELARYLALENLPGYFPYTAGVFPFKREGEDPTRMFAGEGTPERTNRRFHLLSAGNAAARLSTAFDSVTLYGRDPAERPDIWGKVGTSGVSVCTVDDAKTLYSGFDLAAPSTSVSMTINGPAPVILAFFLNAAIDQSVEKHLRETGQTGRIDEYWAKRGEPRPRYRGALPEGHNGLGLELLGLSGDKVVDAETYARIRADVLHRVRGTVQADILKEDQAQNTCIFSTEFSLRAMGDIQQYFCENDVQFFYSVSISGYHIAEAGAYPITQLAFTLANAFTYVEYYLARGLAIDDFAPNLSFFFSNGLDAEYAVIGRVARRIWAIAMRERYGADERSQKLKYHIQTSGRSLHAQEMAFNDIRTTLQALVALQDHCNSLHTNAYDEAVTTPTEESVRRAVAIQLILAREFGPLKNENMTQGAYLTEELTQKVEDAVLAEFERLSERGGVLGAMETMYQRGKIQDESMRYEYLKHSGGLPIVGVNTFRGPENSEAPAPRELIRASVEERREQLESLSAFQERHVQETRSALERLQQKALARENVFAELMETVKVASLGQIVDALFAVGGRYRRAM